MAGFTKLVPEIVQSSIWNESSDVRIVWITMLAVKDENGFVRGDARTLSRLANVTLEAAEEALTTFNSPDPLSKTPDYDGRRIEPVAGGWLIINHAIYRARDDVTREQTRERVRKYRERMAETDPVTLRNVTEPLPSVSVSESVSASVSEDSKSNSKSTHGKTCLIDAAETLDLPPSTSETPQTPPTPKKSKPRSSGAPPTEEELALYKAYPKKTGKPSALRAIRGALKKASFELLMNAVTEYAKARALVKDPAERKTFTKHPQGWFNDERWNDDRDTWYPKGCAPKEAAFQERLEEIKAKMIDWDNTTPEEGVRLNKERLALMERGHL